MDDQQKQMSEAINLLLTEIIDRKKRKPANPASGVGLYTSSEMDDLEFQDFATDPIGQSLPIGLRHAGDLLAKKYGVGALRSIAKAIADDENYRTKISILDFAWHGIKDAKGDFWLA